MPLDYARFARQIALAELGPHGQQKLSEVTVDLSALPVEAVMFYERAGGITGAGGLSVALETPVADGPCARVGLGAFGAVEAARRALGEAGRGVPEALRERLLP